MLKHVSNMRSSAINIMQGEWLPSKTNISNLPQAKIYNVKVCMRRAWSSHWGQSSMFSISSCRLLYQPWKNRSSSLSNGPPHFPTMHLKWILASFYLKGSKAYIVDSEKKNSLYHLLPWHCTKGLIFTGDVMGYETEKSCTTWSILALWSGLQIKAFAFYTLTIP